MPNVRGPALVARKRRRRAYNRPSGAVRRFGFLAIHATLRRIAGGGAQAIPRNFTKPNLVSNGEKMKFDFTDEI